MQDWFGIKLGSGVRAILLLIALIGVTALGGCQHLRRGFSPAKPLAAGFKFPPARLTPDSVILEIGLAYVATEDIPSFEDWWQRLDHQAIDVARRRQWDAQGFRLAVVTPAGMSELHRLLSRHQPAADSESPPIILPSPEAEFSATQFRSVEAKTFRAGQPRQIAVAPVWEVASWTHEGTDHPSFGRGENVACMLEIVATNQGSGNAQIRLAPRLKYGPRAYVTQAWQRAFEVDVSRQETRLHQLDFDLPLQLGQAIAITSTPDAAGLGELFFGFPNIPEDMRESYGRRVLLVRLVQTQEDDLFR